MLYCSVKINMLKNHFSILCVAQICTLSLQLCAEEHFRTGSVEITSELAKDSIQSETSLMMSMSGIDFAVLLQQATEGNINAVRLLLWSSANVGLDGAASDGFGYYIVTVGKAVGDEKLLQALTNLDKETLDTIKFFILDEYGYSLPKDDAKSIAISKASETFPRSWKHLNTKLKTK